MDFSMVYDMIILKWKPIFANLGPAQIFQWSRVVGLFNYFLDFLKSPFHGFFNGMRY